MKTAELRLAKQRAAAFELGRLTIDFQFYLAQSLALAVLPKADHLCSHEKLYFNRTRDILSQISEKCRVLMPNQKLDTYIVFARSQLKRFDNETPKHWQVHYNNVHRELTAGIGRALPSWFTEMSHLPSYQVMLHGLGNNLNWSSVHKWLIQDIICYADMQLFYRIWGFLHDKPTALPNTPREETDYYEKDFNILQRAYALGYWLEQCTCPINVVSFMNLMDHPQLIDVFDGLNEMTNTSTDQPAAMEAHRNDNGGPMIFRCLSAGDIRPRSAPAMTVRVLARRYFFSTSIIERLQALYSSYVDTSRDNFLDGDVFAKCETDPPHRFKGCMSRMDSSVTGRDHLKNLVADLGRDIATQLLCPGGLVNEDRDRWMYQQRNDGKTLMDIRRHLEKQHPEWEQLESDQGVAKAINVYIERRGLERPLKGLGRPTKKKSG